MTIAGAKRRCTASTVSRPSATSPVPWNGTGNALGPRSTSSTPAFRTPAAGCIANACQQCAFRPATDHLALQQQHAIQRIGPGRRGLTQSTARVLMASSHGEIDDQWFRTASNPDRVALQALLKQGPVLTKAGETWIVPASDVAYGLDPELSRPSSS